MSSLLTWPGMTGYGAQRAGQRQRTLPHRATREDGFKYQGDIFKYTLHLQTMHIYRLPSFKRFVNVANDRKILHVDGKMLLMLTW